MAENPLPQVWWDASLEADKRRDAQLAAVKKIRDDQKYRYAAGKLYYGMYLNRDPLNLEATGYAKASVGSPEEALRFNLVQSVIDTKLAKLEKNTPRTRFLTTGGDWAAQRKAKRLTQFVDGERYRLEQAPKDRKVQLHASIFGTGALHVFEEEQPNGKHLVGTEWAFPLEFRVDAQDGMYGMPRSLHRERGVSKELLLNKFAAGGEGGKFRAAIVSAPLITPLGTRFSGAEHPQCTVIESWHLASGMQPAALEGAAPKGDADAIAKDADAIQKREAAALLGGRHMLSIEGVSFTDEAWEQDDYPFVFLRFGGMPLGFWGRGDAEDLKPLQRELTRSLMRLQEILFLMAVPRILLQTGGEVNVTHLRNVVGDVIRYTGTIKPEIWAQNSIPPELVNHILWLIEAGYQQVGLTQMSAGGAKPEGLDSGKALREYHDIESERFMETGRAVEEYNLAVSRKIINTARNIAEREDDYVVRAPDRRDFLTVSWKKDIDLEEDAYILQAYPVSMLSHTVAGRLNEVKDMMDLGLVDQQTSYKLLDFPDLEAVNSLELAAVNDIDRVIEKVLNDGEYEPPDPLQNLEYGIRMMHLAYLRARQDGAPQNNLEGARQWINEAQAMLDQAAAGAMAGAGLGLPQDPNAPPADALAGAAGVPGAPGPAGLPGVPGNPAGAVGPATPEGLPLPNVMMS